MRKTGLVLGALLLVVGAPISSSDASDSDFQARCSAPGVIRCVGFDVPADIAGEWGDPTGILPGETTPTLDASTKASGNSSIKFTIPSNSGSDSSGSYFANFSDDLSIQFGENQEFFVQWRQRFSAEMLNTYFRGSGGFKQAIIVTGDQPGRIFATCEATEVVMNQYYQEGFPILYNSCTGSTSHGAYDGLYEPFGSFDFKLQNARPSPYCLYSQEGNPPRYFPPDGNCFGYFPDEWMTYQVNIKTGPRVNDEWAGSRLKVWIAREGKPAEIVIDFGPYNLSAGNPNENQRFGKVWLLPYQTGKDRTQAHPTAYTWYDELIISRNRIADPSTGTTLIPPRNLRVVP